MRTRRRGIDLGEEGERDARSGQGIYTYLQTIIHPHIHTIS
jgi:hypothetical protein